MLRVNQMVICVGRKAQDADIPRDSAVTGSVSSLDILLVTFVIYQDATPPTCHKSSALSLLPLR